MLILVAMNAINIRIYYEMEISNFRKNKNNWEKRRRKMTWREARKTNESFKVLIK